MIFGDCKRSNLKNPFGKTKRSSALPPSIPNRVRKVQALYPFQYFPW